MARHCSPRMTNGPLWFTLPVGARSMAEYTITFLGADGAPMSQKTIICDCDDDAIDLVGDSTHLHGIDIHHGERHVVRFPPWPRVF